MQKIKNLIEQLQLEIVAGEQGIDNDITGVYIGDLLSWVMANVQQGNIWVTIQTHVNIVAVATLGEVAGIIIPENAEIEDATIEKSNSEGIPLLRTSLTAYELAIKINELEN